MPESIYDSFKEIIGAIHIHSTYSDGSGTISDIAADAKTAGLDFIILTDHDTLQPKRDGWEKLINGVAVIVGYELNDREDKNHYIALNIDKEVDHNGSADQYVNAVQDAGGIGIIAHPDEKKPRWKNLKYFPWRRWDLQGYQLIEIWNHLSEWKEGLTLFNCFHHILAEKIR